MMRVEQDIWPKRYSNNNIIYNKPKGIEESRDVSSATDGTKV